MTDIFWGNSGDCDERNPFRFLFRGSQTRGEASNSSTVHANKQPSSVSITWKACLCSTQDTDTDGTKVFH